MGRKFKCLSVTTAIFVILILNSIYSRAAERKYLKDYYNFKDVFKAEISYHKSYVFLQSLDYIKLLEIINDSKNISAKFIPYKKVILHENGGATYNIYFSETNKFIKIDGKTFSLTKWEAKKISLLFDSAEDAYISGHNREKEKILNVILNSIQFGSIYNAGQVFLMSNELLSADSLLVLKKGKHRVKMAEKRVLEKKKRDYAAIGDFTLPESEPEKARVQMFFSSSKQLLNFILEKNAGDWLVEHYSVMEE